MEMVDCLVNSDLLLLMREPWGYKMGASEAHLQAYLGGQMIPFIDVIFFPLIEPQETSIASDQSFRTEPREAIGGQF